MQPPPAQVQSRALRRYLARHNRQALMLSFFALVLSAAMWGIAYLFSFWFALVGVSISRSFNPSRLDEILKPPDQLVPHFPAKFAVAATVMCLLTALLRRLVNTNRLREARHYFLWVFVELFMTIPNVTFSIWGNLSAIIRLRREEAEHAWRLIERLETNGGRLGLAILPLEINNPKTLRRVLFPLQVSGLSACGKTRTVGSSPSNAMPLPN